MNVKWKCSNGRYILKKILVTGGTGVLAHNIAMELLKDKNYCVYISTRNVEQYKKITVNIPCVSNEEIFHTDFLNDFDLLINCAFPRQFDLHILSGALAWYNNLLLQAVKMNVKAFLNISSQSLYGNYRENYVAEDAVIFPQDTYALTKYACELLSKNMLSFVDMKITHLRLASLIGSEYPERVINKIILNAKENDRISINNDKNVFGYMDIDDAVSGILAFIKNTQCEDWDFCYNLGVQQSEFKDFAFIAQTIANLFAEKGKVKQLEIQKKDKAEKLCRMNSEKFYMFSNWKPHFTLEAAIEKIFMYLIH